MNNICIHRWMRIGVCCCINCRMLGRDFCIMLDNAGERSLVDDWIVMLRRDITCSSMEGSLSGFCGGNGCGDGDDGDDGAGGDSCSCPDSIGSS